ncbi:hypothetical protein EC991_007832, partial [Linnemannia zychae]
VVRYLAPEAVRIDIYIVALDIFSPGIVFYNMVCHHRTRRQADAKGKIETADSHCDKD